MKTKKQRGNKNNFVTKKEFNSLTKLVNDLTDRIVSICDNLKIDISDIIEKQK